VGRVESRRSCAPPGPPLDRVGQLRLPGVVRDLPVSSGGTARRRRVHTARIRPWPSTSAWPRGVDRDQGTHERRASRRRPSPARTADGGRGKSPRLGAPRAPVGVVAGPAGRFCRRLGRSGPPTLGATMLRRTLTVRALRRPQTQPDVRDGLNPSRPRSSRGSRRPGCSGSATMVVRRCRAARAARYPAQGSATTPVGGRSAAGQFAGEASAPAQARDGPRPGRRGLLVLVPCRRVSRGSACRIASSCPGEEPVGPAPATARCGPCHHRRLRPVPRRPLAGGPAVVESVGRALGYSVLGKTIPSHVRPGDDGEKGTPSRIVASIAGLGGPGRAGGTSSWTG